jgi:hypothetical protein
MQKTDYRKVLRATRAEYDLLVQRRVELEKRILNLKQTIAGLMALCDEKGEKHRPAKSASAFPSSIKLTSATRQVLAQSDYPLEPPELRDALVERGLTVTRYANPLAVIHNTLIRLRRQGEAVQVSGAWVLTDKGRLALKMDQIDLPAERVRARTAKKVR